MARIALVGDYSPSVIAHQAIPLALARAARRTSNPVTWDWIPTAALNDVPAQLNSYHAVWLVPASPYANTSGALDAVGFARRSGRPFLGTCAGFQHALLEYAESAWNIGHAAHQELEPAASDPVISLLSCRMVEVEGRIHLEPGSRLAGLYGSEDVTEGYHCNYGLNPRWAARLESGPLRVAARDPAGEVRAVELEPHPFFIATLYQPERSVLRDLDHPLIAAFVTAAVDGGTS
jgi:CTP synthase (UTP-ammonia lyase)